MKQLLALDFNSEEFTKLVKDAVKSALIEMKEKDSEHKVVSITKAASLLGIGNNKIKEMVENGLLTATPDGKINLSSVIDYANGNTKMK